MRSMVWSVYRDRHTLQSEVVEVPGTGKLNERTGRPAHRYSIWHIGANIWRAGSGQYLMQEPNQLLRDKVVKYKY